MTGAKASSELSAALRDLGLVLSPFFLRAVFLGVFEVRYIGPVAVVAALVIATVRLRRTGRSWRGLGLCRPASWPRTLVGAVGLYILWIVVAAVLVAPLLVALGLGLPDTGQFDFIRGNLAWYLFFVGPMSWGVAALGEELLVRGFVLNRIAEGLGSSPAAWRAAVVVQGAIFGIGHWWQGPAGVLGITVIGILLGAAYVRAGRNLWLPIITHGIIDTVSFTALYLDVAAPR